MNKTKKHLIKLCILAMLTALYVVMSAFLKINFIGNIMLDLGYIIFVIALCEFKIAGAVVGVLGCTLESILFSAYGFSISWMVANLIIGVICGLIFYKTDKLWIRILTVIGACAIGLLVAKTGIECLLYSIPLAVKLPKNAVAFAIDTTTMIIGLIIYQPISKRIRIRIEDKKKEVE